MTLPEAQAQLEKAKGMYQSLLSSLTTDTMTEKHDELSGLIDKVVAAQIQLLQVEDEMKLKRA